MVESARVSPLTLQEAADELGLHYMTVYRYVRTGRLPAERIGSEWRIDAADVADIARARSSGARPVGGAKARGVSAGIGAASVGPRGADHVGRLVARLLVGDEPGAWAVVQAALANGIEPDDLYLHVMGPAMREIGDRWSDGRASVAQEHLASAVMQRICGRLGPLFSRPGRTRGTVVLGGPAGEHHALPSVMFGDLLRGCRLSVSQLGADTPVSSFVEAARRADRLVGVAIGCTTSGNEAAVAETVQALHEAGISPVVVGGRAVESAAAAERLGADVWAPDGEAGLRLFGDLAVESARRRRLAKATAR